MKTVLLRYDISNDLIAVPDRVDEDLIWGVMDWIKTNPLGAKYRYKNNPNYPMVHTVSILDYLNSFCLKDDEEKAYLIKEHVSSDTVADEVEDF